MVASNSARRAAASSALKTTFATARALPVGLAATFGLHLLLPSLMHVPFDGAPLEQSVAAVLFLGCSLGAARVASSTNAGVLEVAAVLFFAHLPLAVAQLAALHPDVGLGAGPEVNWDAFYARARLQQEGFLIAEATSVACLVAGAAGLACNRSWTRALLLLVAVVLGWGIGGWLGQAAGSVIGGPTGVAGVVFVITAHDVRGRRAGAARGARVMSVLAVAMAVCAVTGFAWQPRQVGFTETAAEIVFAHRVLLIRLIGCAVALLFALGAGRPSRTSPASVLAVLLGAVLLVGGAAHLRVQRVAFFNYLWPHRRELGPHLLCGCESPWERVPTLGEPFPIRSLPWPLTGELDGRTQLSRIRVYADVDDPAWDRPPGELERLRALPAVPFDHRGLAHPEDADAPEQQLRVPDGLPYGKVLRSLDRAVDAHGTHLHLLLREGSGSP